MQFRGARAHLVLAVGIVAARLLTDVNARPMHADIIPKYHRYLAEKEAVNAELDDWLSTYGKQGPKHGYIPVTESRSLDDAREDQLQRFYLAKEQINEAREANPMAEFTTDGPLTLMTMDEFKEFLLNSHVGEKKENTDQKGKRHKTLFGRVRNGTMSEGSKSDSNSNSAKLPHGTRNVEPMTTWAPAPAGSSVDSVARRLLAAGSSQKSYSWRSYNSNDDEPGQLSPSNTQIQSFQPPFQATPVSVGNSKDTTNRGWNFGDVSTSDSAQVADVTSVDTKRWNRWTTHGWWSGSNWMNNGNQPARVQWSWWSPNQSTQPSSANNPPAAKTSQARSTSIAAAAVVAPSTSQTAEPPALAPGVPALSSPPAFSVPVPAPALPAAALISARPAEPTVVPAPPVVPAPVPTPVPAPIPASFPAIAPVPAPVPAPRAVHVPAPEAPVPASGTRAAIMPAIATGSASTERHKTTEYTTMDTTTAKAPKSVDWSTSKCLKPPDLQGQCGSCWAFAALSAIETAQCLAQGGKIAPTYSKQQLVSCENRSFGCSGGAAVYAMEYVRDNGICLESSYPYTSADTFDAPTCSQSCTSTKVGITDIVKLSAGDESALIDALEKQPVVVSVISNNPAWKQYKSGIMSFCADQMVDHAVLAVGYDATSIKLKNSWGTEWGEDGYVRISRSTQNMGTCAVLTDMLYPKL